MTALLDSNSNHMNHRSNSNRGIPIDAINTILIPMKIKCQTGQNDPSNSSLMNPNKEGNDVETRQQIPNLRALLTRTQQNTLILAVLIEKIVKQDLPPS